MNKPIVFTKESIKQAGEALSKGGLVAFPTETVYGLGADATNPQAIKKVFEAKGRPSDNPLIVHIKDPKDIEPYVNEVTSLHHQLMNQFWPGPLTIIFEMKNGAFDPIVTGGKSTVAFRMPDNEVALALLNENSFPLVGPSANKSGKPSPTSYEHVLNDYPKGEIDGVLKNSEPLTKIGIESTVVYPKKGQVFILRPGNITAQQLEDKGFTVTEMTPDDQLESGQILSPGVKYTHYSPEQPVYLIAYPKTIKEWRKVITQLSKDEKIGVLADESILKELDTNQIVSTYSLGQKGDIKEHTRRLFSGLRALEQTKATIIVAQGLKETQENHGFMNRLTKASNFVL
ncbi:L-threonylcarbamoyladenylate synthase [Dolosicoccus paucivorans]|uniref:Threonylcarbamoyl-AMP synthase n=1 Tax=Dolosicoccus paucivorans TaxID=84521 RepID=A0A1G8NVC7_9LACT|nr:L-threonylcarbamoyladenylate synthase [Dolosicoccus paucivorans]PMB84860.1 threonylcarbamoyl-AMP synthase [Dolosicoccus paucivorans]PMC58856.1 threonylcarbamoyl-AMP synthase [Dolosicoccus paucivorans]SDI84177.1 L-threonylcarbamoyladenylate synthase [Dolosicoccus paucivorans]